MPIHTPGHPVLPWGLPRAFLCLAQPPALPLPLSCPQTSAVVLSPAAPGLESPGGPCTWLCFTRGSLGLSADLAVGTLLCPAHPHTAGLCPGCGGSAVPAWATFPSWFVLPCRAAPLLLLTGKILGVTESCLESNSLMLCCAVVVNFSHFGAS